MSLLALSSTLRTTCTSSLLKQSRQSSPITNACRAISAKPQATAMLQHQRYIHASTRRSAAPKSKDRGPASKEDTQTDFGAMNVLGSTPVPTTAVDMCLDDGFALDSGLRIIGGGVLLAAGEAFAWRPWTGDAGGSIRKLRNAKGQFNVDNQAWAILDLLWPKPDLLVLGTGPTIAPLSMETRQRLSEMGIRVEVQDTRNAAAQFNLLATERGVQQVAAALIPIGHKDSR